MFAVLSHIFLDAVVSLERLTQVLSSLLFPTPPEFLALLGSAVGSCLVSEDGSWNLGMVQISPQATANGSLSIVYVNGDRCGNQQRFSTRITFECAQTLVRVLVNNVLPGCGSISRFPLTSESSNLKCACVSMGFRPSIGWTRM